MYKSFSERLSGKRAHKVNIFWSVIWTHWQCNAHLLCHQRISSTNRTTSYYSSNIHNDVSFRIEVLSASHLQFRAIMPLLYNFYHKSYIKVALLPEVLCNIFVQELCQYIAYIYDWKVVDKEWFFLALQLSWWENMHSRLGHNEISYYVGIRNMYYCTYSVIELVGWSWVGFYLLVCLFTSLYRIIYYALLWTWYGRRPQNDNQITSNLCGKGIFSRFTSPPSIYRWEISFTYLLD